MMGNIMKVLQLLSKTAAKFLTEWKPFSKHLMSARFNTSYGYVAFLQCYALTNDAEDNEKEEFCNMLNTARAEIPKYDSIIVMGDLNSKVGVENTGSDEVMETHRMGTISANGKRLLETCLVFNLVIGRTIFQHKNIHKETLVSP